jgi:hypothetical protein
MTVKPWAYAAAGNQCNFANQWHILEYNYCTFWSVLASGLADFSVYWKQSVAKDFRLETQAKG